MLFKGGATSNASGALRCAVLMKEAQNISRLMTANNPESDVLLWRRPQGGVWIENPPKWPVFSPVNDAIRGAVPPAVWVAAGCC